MKFCYFENMPVFKSSVFCISNTAISDIGINFYISRKMDVAILYLSAFLLAENISTQDVQLYTVQY